MAVSRDIGLVRNSLLELCDCLVGVYGKLELELAGTLCRSQYELKSREINSEPLTFMTISESDMG